MPELILDTYRNLHLPDLAHRRVDVWVPDAYHQLPEARFPVLYMQDGQNIFRPRLSIKTGWRVTENINALVEKKAIIAPIVVGMTSTMNRVGDYLPQKSAQSAPGRIHFKHYQEEFHVRIQDFSADRYLEWIVTLLKPFIDKTYRTNTDPASTVIMGSSMGGLISLYALCEYPEVFGKAGCLSTHWPILGDPMLEYLRASLPPAGSHRLYFDRGTLGYDAYYARWQDQMDALAEEACYRPEKDYLSLIFHGDDHNEVYWANRLQYPLRFLLGV